MRGVSYVMAIGLLIFVTSCSKQAVAPGLDPIVVEKELRAMETGHRKAIDSKDIDGVLKYYAPNLITISPEEPIRYGNEWIRATVAELYGTYDFYEDFKFIDMRIIGDRVAASYSFSSQMIPLAGGEKIEQTGKGMCILKLSESKVWQFEWNSYCYDIGGEE